MWHFFLRLLIKWLKCESICRGHSVVGIQMSNKSIDTISIANVCIRLYKNTQVSANAYSCSRTPTGDRRTDIRAKGGRRRSPLEADSISFHRNASETSSTWSTYVMYSHFTVCEGHLHR